MGDDDGGRKAIWASDTNGAGDNLKLWLQEDGSLSLRDADSNDLVWSSYSGGRGEGPYSFKMPDPGFPVIWTVKTALSGQQTRLKVSAIRLGLLTKCLRAVSGVGMATDTQQLLVSIGAIAVNQIGLLKELSMETILRFTKNTRLSMTEICKKAPTCM